MVKRGLSKEKGSMADCAKKHKGSPIPGTVDVEDRIGALPDSLLLHILSFLKMKEVIATSLLSRRWRSLWTSVPTLDFGTWWPVIDSDVTTFIGLSLMLYDSPKIRKFRAHFDYEDVADCHIDSWIRFAVKHGVEELDLNLLARDHWTHVEMESEKLYQMPHCLFDCKALEVLRLTSCELNLPSSLSLVSLKTLELRHVRLSDLDTSGCPVLENLIMQRCNMEGRLDIYAPNQKLVYLDIYDIHEVIHKDSVLTLFAPNLSSIEFTGSMRRVYNIKNLSSLKSATFEFYGMDEYESDDVRLLVELLEYLSHSTTLKFSQWCIQVLSFLEVEGLKLPPLRATSLELEIDLNKSELLGMASLLRSSHYLESLIINTSASELSMEIWPPSAGCDFDEWELLELALPANPQLKIVKINNFLQSESCWLCREPEPISVNIDEFLEKWEKEIKLVKLLLKICKMLDKMIISTIKMPFWPLKSELLLGLTKKLLALPRASTTAEICFS